MSNYQTMSQNQMYNSDQPMYEAGGMSYELNGNMMKAYSSKGCSECDGVLTAPKMSMLP